jgi:hypothetical protein
LLIAATLADAFWFIDGGYRYGLQFQGPSYTHGVLALNIMWIAFLWLIVYCWKSQPRFGANLLAHWMLFAWLAWYAFPFLGELP